MTYAKLFELWITVTTAIIEFSRGSEHGGYREAFPHLPDNLLKHTGIVYVEVSFEVSLHKNRRRYNPDRLGSILEHSLPDAKMERLYRDDDWTDLTASDGGYLQVGSIRVPYTVFENEDDVTTGKQEQLTDRLETELASLWDLHLSR